MGSKVPGTSTLCMTILAFVVLQVGHSDFAILLLAIEREASTGGKLLGDRLPVVEGVLVDDEAAIGKLAVVIGIAVVAVIACFNTFRKEES